MRKFTLERSAAADGSIFVFVTGCDCAGALSFSIGREERGFPGRNGDSFVRGRARRGSEW
jgi:hypothetical protein